MSDALITEDWASPLWRLDNLYHVLAADGQEIPFRMRPEQKEFMQALHNLNVILKARQLGFTTFIEILMLDQAVFNKNFKAVCIADTLINAQEIFRTKIAFPWSKLPAPLRQSLGVNTDSKTEFIFGNGSSVGVTTSARGGTLHFLHVSEFGKICALFPEKANEIVTGSFPAVTLGGVIVIESTAKGQAGKFYDMTMKALKRKNMGMKDTQLDFRLHFFAWWQKPENRLNTDGVHLDDAMVSYFTNLAVEHSIILENEQKAWYAKTFEMLGDDMKAEHPSYPEEAFEVAIEGAIFSKEMSLLRRQGGIGSYPWVPNRPVNTFWDLGVGKGNATAVWCQQRIQGRNRLIRYFEAENQGLGFMVNKLNEWGYTWGTDYLPHDAASRRAAIEVHTHQSILRDLGRKNTFIVPKVPYKNMGIEALRSFLMTCEIDVKACVDGVRALDSYQREWDMKGGRWSDRPLHNWASNGVDALMQGAQGYQPDSEWAAPVNVYSDEPYDDLVGF